MGPVRTVSRGDPNRVRIIAGRLRRRRLHFPLTDPPIRPTPDRVRETVFNWLTGMIPGARCLDLFAGSGALGFEALSRGAQAVEFVDSHAAICRYLRETLADLEVQGSSVWTADAFIYLEGGIGSFDLVFLDPPFRESRHALLLESLFKGGHLNPRAQVYLEWAHDRRGRPFVLPSGWSFRREACYGQVAFGLAVPPALPVSA